MDRNYIKFYVCNSDWFVFFDEWDYKKYEFYYNKLDWKDWFHVWLFWKFCIIYKFKKN